MEDGLAQQIERDGQTARRDGRVELPRCCDGVLDGLTSDEPRGKLSREPVPPDKAEDARLFAQPQKDGTQHQE
jgi:hypothetical protein